MELRTRTIAKLIKQAEHFIDHHDWDEAAVRCYQILALDGEGKPVDSITSNPGHCLNLGIFDREKALSESEYRLARLQTEPYKRWALGFSCFFFTLVGGALAIRLGHADVVTIFFLVFLPIVVVYYPMLALGADQAKSGSLPPYAVWLGNGILLLGGIWQVRKVIRH